MVRQAVEQLAEGAAARLQMRRAPGRRGAARAGADSERAGGERQRDSGEQADRADRARVARQRSLKRQRLAQQQHAAGADDRQRREHARFAERPAEGDGEAVADATAVPAAVQHEAHEHAERDQRQADDLAAALVEHADPRQAGGQ